MTNLTERAVCAVNLTIMGHTDSSSRRSWLLMNAVMRARNFFCYQGWHCLLSAGKNATSGPAVPAARHQRSSATIGRCWPRCSDLTGSELTGEEMTSKDCWQRSGEMTGSGLSSCLHAVQGIPAPVRGLQACCPPLCSAADPSKPAAPVRSQGC